MLFFTKIHNLFHFAKCETQNAKKGRQHKVIEGEVKFWQEMLAFICACELEEKNRPR